MKATIEVKDRKEADAIRTALEDPVVRAQVVVVGTLKALTPKAQARVLLFAKDTFEESWDAADKAGAK
jgi:hypothetical protein